MIKLFESLLSPRKNNSGKSGNVDDSSLPTNPLKLSGGGTSNNSERWKSPSSPSKNNSNSVESRIENNNLYNNSNSNSNRYPNIPIECTIKILVLGGAKVGKTSIIRRYIQECFTTAYIKTIGIDLSTLIVRPKNENRKYLLDVEQLLKDFRQQQDDSGGDLSMEDMGDYFDEEPSSFLIHFWDISHSEIKGNHFNSLFNDVSGAILVFDSTNANSILAMDEWKTILQYKQLLTTKKIPIALLANKSDTGESIISATDLEFYCKNCNFDIWKYTSCKKDIGIQESIDQLLSKILDQKVSQFEERKSLKIISIYDQQKLLKQQQQQQQQQQQYPMSQSINTSGSSSNSNSSQKRRKDRPNSQSVPNSNNSPQNSPNKQHHHQQQHSHHHHQPTSPISQIEISKINELLDTTNQHYGKFQKDIETLMVQSSGSNRYNDLIQLERQRNNEYVKICNNLKKLIHPNVFNHHHHHHHHSKNNNNKFTRESLQFVLEENIKKWDSLINNLLLEKSLKLQQQKQQQQSCNNSDQKNSVSLVIKKENNNSSLDQDEEDFIEEDEDKKKYKRKNNNYSSSSGRKATSPHSSSHSLKGHHHHHGGHHHHHHSSNPKYKLGFGFRNNGKNLSSSITISQNNYSIDTDNPASTSSSLTSSSRSISPNSSPPPSPPNSFTNSFTNSFSSSPSVLPSSYHLNVTMIPDVKFSTSSEFVNSFK
ncbi:hypothetical protein CYY_007506 [Polysphondylium violaceum]|uniref:Uncharacterized protein n=1 Tax=Polysphondylium violaceum TaxID=133409 RepID=A0A8J4PX57_9MYCE|nr:hypothetical protein CYY_007506 [Polysphondylium violaceum]